MSEVEPSRIDGGEATVLKLVRGTILAHPIHGAFAIEGTIFAYWMQLGGLSSDLGFPLEDAAVPSDPREPIVQRFERGALRWSAQTGPSRG